VNHRKEKVPVMSSCISKRVSSAEKSRQTALRKIKSDVIKGIQRQSKNGQCQHQCCAKVAAQPDLDLQVYLQPYVELTKWLQEQGDRVQMWLNVESTGDLRLSCDTAAGGRCILQDKDTTKPLDCNVLIVHRNR